MHTFNPASQSVEDYFYPRPGKNNAKTTLKLLVLKCDDTREASVLCHDTISLLVVSCSLTLKNCDCLYHCVNFSPIVVNTLYISAGCMEGKQCGSSY